MTQQEFAAIEYLRPLLEAELKQIERGICQRGISVDQTEFMRGQASVYIDLLNRKKQAVAIEMLVESNKQAEQDRREATNAMSRVQRLLTLRKRHPDGTG